MPRFNFNDITLSGKADISKVMENFDEIETNGITGAEVTAAINNAKTEVNSATDTKLDNYTTTANLKPLAKVGYSYGTGAPSGGNNGDVYDQYFN